MCKREQRKLFLVYGGIFRARLHLAALRAVTTVRERRFELEESSIIGIRIALIINSLSATLYFFQLMPTVFMELI